MLKTNEMLIWAKGMKPSSVEWQTTSILVDIKNKVIVLKPYLDQEKHKGQIL